MIENTLKGSYGDTVELHHVRMAFSKRMDQVGKVRLLKLVELLRVLAGIFIGRVRHRANVLYYFPAGPNFVPIVRDIALLLPTRWMFRRTIFHFRASGLSEYYQTVPAVFRPVLRMVYFGADIGVRLSELAPEDPKILKAKHEFIVPNGIEDAYSEYLDVCKRGPEDQKREALHISYVGILSESKGTKILLEACTILAKQGISFLANLVGEFESEAFENYIRGYCFENGLDDKVKFHGVLTGCEKYKIVASSDVFCFPSFFESETAPVSVLEALCFGVTVVATRWRGIPSLIEDEVVGFLVPIRSPEAIAEKLRLLMRDPGLRNEMASRGRKRYLESFAINIYYRNMRRVFEAAT